MRAKQSAINGSLKMMASSPVLLLVVLAFAWDHSRGFLINDADTLSSLCFPNDQNCHCSEYQDYEIDIDCSNRSLTAIPNFSKVSDQLKQNYMSWFINMTNNAMKTIPARSFVEFQSLNKNDSYLILIFDHNEISGFENGAFTGINKASVYLYVSFNRLTYLPHAIMELDNLKRFSIDENPILKFDPTVVHSMAKSLYYLYIDYRQLEAGLAELSELTALTTMELYNLTGSYQNLPISPFQFFRNSMEDIFIDESNLETFPCSLVDGHQMRYFFLENAANIRASKVFDCQPETSLKLWILQIMTCELTEFPDVLKFTPDLLGLSLLNNKITDIDENVIPLNTKIRVLNLSSNRLTVIPSALERLKALQYLYVENNQIAYVQPTRYLDSLRSICLRGNSWTVYVSTPCNTTYSDSTDRFIYLEP